MDANQNPHEVKQKTSCVQHKTGHKWIPQLPLHFQGLNRVFMFLLQELIKGSSILLQVVFSLLQFSFLILYYVLHPLDLISLYCHGILKRTQKATQSLWLFVFRGKLFLLCSWLPFYLTIVGKEGKDFKPMYVSQCKRGT